MAHALSRAIFNATANQTFTVSNVEYILGGTVGNGAAGIVHRAKRVDNGTPVAVKFLAPDPKYLEEESFEDVARRFAREGQRGPRLDHPSLIKVVLHRF